MPTWKSLTEFSIDLQRMSKDLTVDEKDTVTREMGRSAKKSADAESARALGGDRAFSGWRRGKPIPLDVRLITQRGTTILAPNKRSAGPWTVANQGRNQGNARGFSGPGINRSTGATARTKAGRVRKTRAFRAQRWNGVTQPKRTADRAVRDMERTVPRVADKAVRKVIAKRFDVT